MKRKRSFHNITLIADPLEILFSLGLGLGSRQDAAGAGGTVDPSPEPVQIIQGGLPRNPAGIKSEIIWNSFAVPQKVLAAHWQMLAKRCPAETIRDRAVISKPRPALLHHTHFLPIVPEKKDRRITEMTTTLWLSDASSTATLSQCR